MCTLPFDPFRYRDRLTGNWVEARYVAEQHEIATRHAQYELLGPPEVREVNPDARYISPWRKQAPALQRFRYRLYEAS